MDFLAEGLRRAVALLVSRDAEVYGVTFLTLRVALTATLIACALGLPLGYLLGTRPFWGRRAALTMVNTALAFPTVVVGLLLYGLLSRRGPLGGLGWLYTWQAIVVGDVLLALPIATALSAAAVQGVDPRIRRTAETLGAGPIRTAWTVAREARFAHLDLRTLEHRGDVRQRPNRRVEQQVSHRLVLPEAARRAAVTSLDSAPATSLRGHELFTRWSPCCASA